MWSVQSHFLVPQFHCSWLLHSANSHTLADWMEPVLGSLIRLFQAPFPRPLGSSCIVPFWTSFYGQLQPFPVPPVFRYPFPVTAALFFAACLASCCSILPFSLTLLGSNFAVDVLSLINSELFWDGNWIFSILSKYGAPWYLGICYITRILIMVEKKIRKYRWVLSSLQKNLEPSTFHSRCPLFPGVLSHRLSKQGNQLTKSENSEI